MSKNFCCLLVVPFLCARVFSQYYFYDANRLEPDWRMETGIQLGIMNCLTDLGGQKGNGKKFLRDVNWSCSKLSAGWYFSVTRRDFFGLRFAFAIGAVEAYDSLLKEKGHPATLRYKRNLHFKSKISEWTTAVEFHPLFLWSNAIPRVSPYCILGIGIFKFDPEARLNGEWIKLRPLRTEGQGFKEYPDRVEYKQTQLHIPIGMGAKYELSDVMVCRIEFEYRILHTDYLDDVSRQYIDPILFYKYLPADKAELAHRLSDRSAEIDPIHQTKPAAIRGNATNNDAYFSVNLKLGFILNRKKL